jgi:hypothetical protein
MNKVRDMSPLARKSACSMRRKEHSLRLRKINEACSLKRSEISLLFHVVVAAAAVMMTSMNKHGLQRNQQG